MAFELQELPYPKNALEPYISEETLEYHHGKHNRTYVTKLNELISGTRFEQLSLEEIMLQSKGGIFNNASQIWNHTLYWNSMSNNSSTKPEGELAHAIKESFGSLDKFKEKFTEAAMTQFGSGWAWLVQDQFRKLSVTKTKDANNPITEGLIPLLNCDVWEHAYYIDTRNDRRKYINNFLEIINWKCAEKNFK